MRPPSIGGSGGTKMKIKTRRRRKKESCFSTPWSFNSVQHIGEKTYYLWECKNLEGNIVYNLSFLQHLPPVGESHYADKDDLKKKTGIDLSIS